MTKQYKKSLIFDLTPTARPFLSNVTRFPHNQSSKHPGPGFYNPADTSQLNDSFNAKGSGNSFISKSQRFPGQIRNTGPGPGHYYNAMTNNQANIHKNPSIFHKHKEKNLFKQDLMVPGPGVYNAKIVKKHISTANFVFESRVDRMRGISSNNPPPGHYNIYRGFDNRKPKKMMKESCFFINPTINTSLSHEKAIIEEIKMFKRDSNTHNIEKYKGKIRGGIAERRFNVHKVQKIKEGPGPGAYISIDSQAKKEVSGAVFKSESERGDRIKQDLINIGPGSYKSMGPLRKKDFHYNMRDSWV